MQFPKFLIVLFSLLVSGSFTVVAKESADITEKKIELRGDHSLHIYNCKTGETFFEKIIKDGKIIPDAHQRLNKLFRDHRQNKVKEINPELVKLLVNIQNKVRDETGRPVKITLICGYRDPKTNEMLHKRGRNVARKSQHCLGNAADIYINRYPLRLLKETCCNVGAKGVGYYPSCGFVHIDVRPGKIARW